MSTSPLSRPTSSSPCVFELEWAHHEGALPKPATAAAPRCRPRAASTLHRVRQTSISCIPRPLCAPRGGRQRPKSRIPRTAVRSPQHLSPRAPRARPGGEYACSIAFAQASEQASASSSTSRSEAPCSTSHRRRTRRTIGSESTSGGTDSESERRHGLGVRRRAARHRRAATRRRASRRRWPHRRRRGRGRRRSPPRGAPPSACSRSSPRRSTTPSEKRTSVEPCGEVDRDVLVARQPDRSERDAPRHAPRSGHRRHPAPAAARGGRRRTRSPRRARGRRTM